MFLNYAFSGTVAIELIKFHIPDIFKYFILALISTRDFQNYLDKGAGNHNPL